jgi:hypothetical protein
MKDGCSSFTSFIRWSLRLPREHGATVCFVLSAILAAKQVTGNVPALFGLCAISLIFFSMHNKWQSIIIAGTGSLILIALHQPLMAILPVVLLSGPAVLKILGERLGPWIAQTGGLLGLSALPLMFALLAQSHTEQLQVLFYAYLFAAAASAACVQIVISKQSSSPWPAILLAAILSAFVFQNSLQLALLISAPFLLQSFWLHNKPSFKALGIVETLCMSWTTIVLWLNFA